jgi:hypothetical protein
MRTLIYVPVIHSSADMGSLGKELMHKNADGSTGNKWQKHSETVNGYWDVIESYFENININVKGVKIYQDGMFVDGEMALKIINEGIKSGSKNSKIISKLIDRGAILIQTEDFGMVKDEYDGFQSILKSKNKITKLFRLFRYKILKTIFLTRRDKFISARIAETLEQSETGILFIGAYHNIIKRLPKDIKVIEMKEIAKVRKYQKIIQSNAKIKKIQFEQLTKYLIEK